MNLSKRDFLQVLGAASVAGMGLGRYADADAATAQAGLYDMAPFGNVSRMPEPWRFTETFLFNDDRLFKPRTLD